MDHAVEEQVARISRRIRRLREEGELTLQELAGRGGLATSTVQKVETGQMMPSLAVLLKVARGLGLTLSEILEDGIGDTDIVHSRACERSELGTGGRLAVERLTGDLTRPSIETWRVTLQSGASSGSDPFQYDGEELVVCENGYVKFRIGEEEYELQAGDSLHFKASIPHSWYNDGTDPARFILTGTVPLVFRAMMQSRVGSSASDPSTQGAAADR